MKEAPFEVCNIHNSVILQKVILQCLNSVTLPQEGYKPALPVLFGKHAYLFVRQSKKVLKMYDITRLYHDILTETAAQPMWITHPVIGVRINDRKKSLDVTVQLC